MTFGMLVLRKAVEGAWPEFNWGPLHELEDAVRTLLEGARPKAASLDAIRRDAASLWSRGLSKLERKIDDMRDGHTDVQAELVDAKTWRDWCSKSVQDTRQASQHSSLAVQSTPTGGQPSTAGAARGITRVRGFKINDNMEAFNTAFPGKCIFKNVFGDCSKAGCPADHDAVDDSSLEKFLGKFPGAGLNPLYKKG